MSDLKYPVGKFEPQPEITQTQRQELIPSIAEAPARLRQAIRGLSPGQLDTPYRPEGWTVRQTVNHIADSHLNGYLRFKFALTEAEPAIKTYEEKLWAEMNDVQKLPINVSLTLLHALHSRWHEALKYVKDDEWNNRTVFHPEHKKTMRLWFLLGMYAWHGKHHVAHITSLRERMGW